MQLTYNSQSFNGSQRDQMQLATDYHGDHKGSLGTVTTKSCDSVRLIRDHNGSLDTMATEYNDSLRLIRGHNGSLSRMAIEYYWKNSRKNIVWLICKLFVHHFVL